MVLLEAVREAGLADGPERGIELMELIAALGPRLDRVSLRAALFEALGEVSMGYRPVARRPPASDGERTDGPRPLPGRARPRRRAAGGPDCWPARSIAACRTRRHFAPAGLGGRPTSSDGGGPGGSHAGSKASSAASGRLACVAEALDGEARRDRRARGPGGRPGASPKTRLLANRFMVLRIDERFDALTSVLPFSTAPSATSWRAACSKTFAG